MFGDCGYDFSAQSVAAALKDSTGDIEVRISSGGGAAFEGLAIYSLLRSSGRRVVVDIDGLAASAASVIAMAGDLVRMGDTALMMIHRASSGQFGNAEEMQKAAEVLTKLDDAMLAAYRRKTRRIEADLRPLLDAETWMTAEEARALGFVDEVVTGSRAAAQVRQSPSWAALPDHVRARLQEPTQPAIVGREMTPEQLQQAIQAAMVAALAPVTERLSALEQARQAEPAIEVAQARTEVELATAKAHEQAVAASFKRFVAEGKIAPSAEAQFRRSCKTAEDLVATVAEYEGAKPVVSTERVSVSPPSKKDDVKVFSKEASAFIKKNFDHHKWTQKVQLTD